MPRGQPRTDLPVTGLQPQGSPYRFDITPILGRCARTQLVCPMRPSRLPWGFNIMPILGRYARTQLICPMLGTLFTLFVVPTFYLFWPARPGARMSERLSAPGQAQAAVSD